MCRIDEMYKQVDEVKELLMHCLFVRSYDLEWNNYTSSLVTAIKQWFNSPWCDDTYSDKTIYRLWFAIAYIVSSGYRSFNTLHEYNHMIRYVYSNTLQYGKYLMPDAYKYYRPTKVYDSSYNEFHWMNVKYKYVEYYHQNCKVTSCIDVILVHMVDHMCKFIDDCEPLPNITKSFYDEVDNKLHTSVKRTYNEYISG